MAVTIRKLRILEHFADKDAHNYWACSIYEIDKKDLDTQGIPVVIGISGIFTTFDHFQSVKLPKVPEPRYLTGVSGISRVASSLF